MAIFYEGYFIFFRFLRGEKTKNFELFGLFVFWGPSQFFFSGGPKNLPKRQNFLFYSHMDSGGWLAVDSIRKRAESGLHCQSTTVLGRSRSHEASHASAVGQIVRSGEFQRALLHHHRVRETRITARLLAKTESYSKVVGKENAHRHLLTGKVFPALFLL